MDSAPVSPSSAPATSTSTSTTTSTAKASPAPQAASTKSTPTANPAVQPSSKSANATPPPSTPSTASATEAPQGETPAERKARLLKYKVDGKEFSVDVNSLSDEEIVTKFQLGEAGRVRMQKAAELMKLKEARDEAIKNDPFDALQKEYGIDVLKLAEQRLIEQFRQEQLPEHEREKIRLQQELEAERAKLRSYEEAQQRAQQEALETQIIEQTQRDFAEALEVGNLPKNRMTMSMMAEIAMAALDHGVELTPKQIAAEVNERLQASSKHVFSSLKGEQLVKYLGDDVVREVLRYQVDKVKAKAPSFVEPPAEAQAVAKEKAAVSKEDFKRPARAEGIKDYMRNLKRGF